MRQPQTRPDETLARSTRSTLAGIVDEATATKPAGMLMREAVRILIDERYERGILDGQEADYLDRLNAPLPSIALDSRAPHDDEPATDASDDPDPETCPDCGHGADLHDRRAEDGACETCDDLAAVGQYAPCADPRAEHHAMQRNGMHEVPEDHEPNADGTACRFCGLAAEPVGPDELAAVLLVELSARGAIDESGHRGHTGPDCASCRGAALAASYTYRGSIERGRVIMAGYTGPADGIPGDDDTRDEPTRCASSDCIGYHGPR